ncbi:hypothetical protein [Aeromonas dhakensis]|uniref:hypothetical protein n=1 Tax=Aeromonas dhakensis TaxID=196024 RepID=UPI0005A7FC7D|nr:hypothetical protein [Aeromonas dhakensis]
MKALIIAVALVATFAQADEEIERCRVNSAGDTVCVDQYGHITKRCHTDGAGNETCKEYD